MNNQSATRKLFLLQFYWVLTTTTFDFHPRIQPLDCGVVRIQLRNCRGSRSHRFDTQECRNSNSDERREDADVASRAGRERLGFALTDPKFDHSEVSPSPSTNITVLHTGLHSIALDPPKGALPPTSGLHFQKASSIGPLHNSNVDSTRSSLS